MNTQLKWFCDIKNTPMTYLIWPKLEFCFREGRFLAELLNIMTEICKIDVKQFRVTMQLYLVIFLPFFHSFIQPYYVTGQECVGVSRAKLIIHFGPIFFKCRTSLHYFPYCRWGNWKSIYLFKLNRSVLRIPVSVQECNSESLYLVCFLSLWFMLRP